MAATFLRPDTSVNASIMSICETSPTTSPFSTTGNDLTPLSMSIAVTSITAAPGARAPTCFQMLSTLVLLGWSTPSRSRRDITPTLPPFAATAPGRPVSLR